jgi:hypothetical protein
MGTRNQPTLKQQWQRERCFINKGKLCCALGLLEQIAKGKTTTLDEQLQLDTLISSLTFISGKWDETRKESFDHFMNMEWQEFISGRNFSG